MPSVYRVTVLWSGFQGAPGYSRFSFSDLVDDVTRNAAGSILRTFLTAVMPYLPGGTALQIQPSVDTHDVMSGALTGSATMTTPPAVLTSAVGAAFYAGGAGFTSTWNTNAIFRGHRVKGRTFFVPAVNCFDTDGTLNTAVIAAVQAAGNVLSGSALADMSVWSRKFTTTHPPVQIDGALSPATSCTVRDQAAQLRSRRT